MTYNHHRINTTTELGSFYLTPASTLSEQHFSRRQQLRSLSATPCPRRTPRPGQQGLPPSSLTPPGAARPGAPELPSTQAPAPAPSPRRARPAPRSSPPRPWPPSAPLPAPPGTCRSREEAKREGGAPAPTALFSFPFSFLLLLFLLRLRASPSLPQRRKWRRRGASVERIDARSALRSSSWGGGRRLPPGP